ncbi:MAG TPA: ferritin family protein [Syntrophales bacterium]|nr:ferritin family protein [Syntrophales bacterium]HOL58919.1 ferritin family protein [Syntrophales bacterium]HPO35246.1 ferritin family protein [Syntrophales bacterium]
MSTFKASDIMEFAMRIEENGENFYRFAIQLTGDEGIKKIFQDLAQAEANHRQLFARIFADLEKERLPETYDGEYAAYLHNYVDGHIIFKRDLLEKELLKIKNAKEAVDFAIRRELDSILYYQEIKGFVPEKDHPTIDKIIEEERSHFKGLSQLLTRLPK